MCGMLLERDATSKERRNVMSERTCAIYQVLDLDFCMEYRSVISLSVLCRARLFLRLQF